jgi:transposase-like protein
MSTQTAKTPGTAKKSKTIRSKYGEVEIDVPQDRKSTFEPKIVGKRKKDISGIDDKIIAKIPPAKLTLCFTMS